MRKTALILPFIILLGGCNPFAKKALPDKRTGIPGSAQVNNYLEQAVTPQSVHCLEEQSKTETSEKTFFHNDYAKISTNLVGRDVSYRWDGSWNKAIGESLEADHPEFINGDIDLPGEELADLGCGGFNSASKEDKKRFWALFLASMARSDSGFDPSFKEGSGRGLFGLDPKKVGAVGGSCAGKDEWDFMEPSYSFSCVLDILKKQLKSKGKLFSPVNSGSFLLGALVGNKREEFFKFFRAHAAAQFSFCVPGFMAPDALINSNVEGEKVTKDCSPKSADRIYEGLNRDQIKGQEDILPDGQEAKGEATSDSQNNQNSDPENTEASPALSK